MSSNVASDLTSSGRMPDMDRIVQVKRLNERSKIVGVRVQIVAGPRLAGSTVSAPVVSNAAIPPRCKKEHLVFPCISVQWPAVTKYHRLSGVPILVINLGIVARPDSRRENLFQRMAQSSVWMAILHKRQKRPVPPRRAKKFGWPTNGRPRGYSQLCGCRSMMMKPHAAGGSPWRLTPHVLCLRCRGRSR